jgi:hypothetical protein
MELNRNDLKRSGPSASRTRRQAVVSPRRSMNYQADDGSNGEGKGNCAPPGRPVPGRACQARSQAPRLVTSPRSVRSCNAKSHPTPTDPPADPALHAILLVREVGLAIVLPRDIIRLNFDAGTPIEFDTKINLLVIEYEIKIHEVKGVYRNHRTRYRLRRTFRPRDRNPRRHHIPG